MDRRRMMKKLAAKNFRPRVELMITNEKGHVLVGTNPRHGSAQLPGGGIDGVAVNTAAKKEALEEVGIKVKSVGTVGARPSVTLIPGYKRDGYEGGSRTFWRTATYVGKSDKKLGDDGDAMRDVRFMPIEEAIARVREPKSDGTKDMIADAREAALRKLQERLKRAGVIKTGAAVDDGAPHQRVRMSPHLKLIFDYDRGAILLQRLDKFGRPVRERPRRAGITKTAMDPLTAAAFAAAGHLGVNAAAAGARALARGEGAVATKLRAMLPKKVRKAVTEFGPNRMADGIAMGVSGRSPSVVQNAVETWGAPETYAYSHAGQVIGQKLGAPYVSPRTGKMIRPTTAKVERKLKKLRKAIAMSPEVNKANLTHSIVPAVNRLLDDRATGMTRLWQDRYVRPKESSWAGKAKNALGTAIGLPLVGLHPDVAVHGIVNRSRLALAGSKAGVEFSKNRFKEGVEEGVREQALAHGLGHMPNVPKARKLPALQDALYAMGLSPMARDTADVGLAATRDVAKNPASAARTAGALSMLDARAGQAIRDKANDPRVNMAIRAARAARAAKPTESELQLRLRLHKLKREIGIGASASYGPPPIPAAAARTSPPPIPEVAKKR